MRALLVVAVIGSGCSGGGDSAYDYASSKGAALYQDMCQVCHGEAGEGGLGPPLRDTKRSTDELAKVIGDRMPANAPGQCTGECATATAQFIHDGLTTRALACNAVQPAPRRLRLLTRREYRATVHDVFGDGVPAMSCARATDCTYRDTCTTGQCEATACDAQTFVYDPHGQAATTVHVAGDFNHWAGTIAAGGLALTRDAASGLWVGTFSLGEGHHQYKLVIDEQQWIVDPRAPASAPDGFGGQNSVVDLACTGNATSDPTSGFPVETRKAGFPFDTDSAAALVTSAHVDAYLDAAERLAESVDPSQLSACDWAGARGTCGRAMLADVGRRLFRRPLAPGELDRFTALVTAGADAKAGVATALEAMLMSPAFLYRSELGQPADNGHYRLTPYEIATALSYTFLGTTPSDALLAAAEHGELDSTKGIEKWARTLLADPRARDQVGEFVAQWTTAKEVLTADKRPDLYPDFDAPTRAALAAETRNFVSDVVFDGPGTYAELMTAGYTVLDPVAARFYGVSGTGHVAYTDGRRAGLLGHASILAASAHSDQTSPVRRGLLVRRNFLCQELPPPPPNGGTVPDIDPTATTRERFSIHSSSAACKGCHIYIDGVGFGFEKFDPVGRWREQENGKPVDASGDMNDVERLGTDTSAPYQSLPELARTLATSQAGPACFVRQYLRFARGQRETLAQRCGRLWVEQKFTAAGGDVRELMVQSVLAPDFVERR